MRILGTLLLLATCGLAPVIWAQSTSAVLTGVVRDEAGKPVADATIHARADDTGRVRTALTDAKGRYRIDTIEPGNWTVIARDGLGRTTKQVLTFSLGLQEVRRQDLVLSEGLSERIEIRAEGKLLDPRRTGSQSSIAGARVDALPIAGRVVTDLAALDSNVQPAAEGTFAGERGAVFTVNGQSGRSNSFLVDGLDNNDQISGTTGNGFFSQLVIQEFVLASSQYSAEFGRASGGVLNILTRRGTNDTHWEVFMQGSEANWSDGGDFIRSLPDSTGSGIENSSNLSLGGRIGGALKEDKAFYFVAFEHSEADNLVPYTGVDRDGVAGGRLIAPQGNDNVFLRTDFNLSPTDSLMLRLSYDEGEQDGVNVGGIATPEAGYRFDESDFAFAGSWTSIISPSLVSELRFNFSDSSLSQRANSTRPGVTRPSGVFGGNSLNRQRRDEQSFQVVQNLTWSQGNHTWKFGLDVGRSVIDIDVDFNPNGNFIYETDIPFEPGDCFVNPGDLGLGLFALISADLNGDDLTQIPCPGVSGVDDDGDGLIDEPANIESYPTVYSLIFGEPQTRVRDTRLALFAQDQWQASAKWLVDFGLRYDLSTYELPSGAGVPSDTIPNGGADRDTDNVAPRVGFTFTPGDDKRWVIRGGGGVFYDKLVLGFPSVAAITSGTSIGLAFPKGLAIEWPETLVESEGIDATIQALDLGGIFLDPLLLKFSTGTELETPYTVQFSLGADRMIGPNQMLGIRATRVRGRNIPIMRDLNPVSGLIYAGTDCSPGNIQDDIEVGIPCHLRDPSTGSIAAIVTEGESWYEGADLNYRLNGRDSWLQASYTWSKAEDLGFDPLKGGISLPQDSDNILSDRGRTDSDRRHRLVLSGEAPLPWWGLRVSGVAQLSSGLPFNVTIGEDSNLDGFLNERPAGVGRNEGQDSSLAAINAIRMQAGLQPVSGLDEPDFYQVDVRLARPIRFGSDAGNGELFLQIFNLFDRQNAGLIEGRVLSRNFGQPITLAGPPRSVELGMRFGF